MSVSIDYAKLRAWREATGKRRVRVAADLDISEQWLRALETGERGRTPSLDMLGRLAAYYGHEPGELLLPIAGPGELLVPGHEVAS